MMGKSTPERCEHCDSTKFFDLLCHECDEVPIPREMLRELQDYLCEVISGHLSSRGETRPRYVAERVEMDALLARTQKLLGEDE